MAGALALSPPAGAQSKPDPAAEEGKRQEARRLGGIALDYYQAGDYKGALANFRFAFSLVPAPTLQLHIARCQDKLDQMKAAAATYRKVIATELKPDAPPVHKQARASAVKELAVVLASMPELRLELPDASPEAIVTIDGKVKPAATGEAIKLDPGKHLVIVKDGTRKTEKSLSLARNEKQTVSMKLAAESGGRVGPTSDNGGLVASGWIITGLGGAGLIMGAVTGGLAISQQDDLLAQCGDDRSCPASSSGAIDEYDTTRLLSSVGLYAGAGLVAVGSTLLIVAAVNDDGDSDVSASVHLSPSSISIRGRF